MTEIFRKCLFKWKFNNETKEEKCIPLQLQKLLANLKFSDKKTIETKDLTNSFGKFKFFFKIF
jgi:hypothetical protein